MDRRDALKIVGGTLAYTLTAGSFASFFVACKNNPEVDWSAKFLSGADALIIEELSEIILPKTDTPGAKEAQVAQSIDALISNVFSQEEKKDFMSEFSAFKNAFKADAGKTFGDANNEERVNWLKALTTPSEGEPSVPQRFFGRIKSMCIGSYFGSELIGKNHLAYADVPGEQRGCVPLQEATGGVTWAL